MNRAPPRPSSNRYSCLPVEECHEDCIPTTTPAAPPIKSPEAVSDALPTVPLVPQFEFVEIPRGKKRSKTERRLPHRLTIAYTSTLSPSLMLKVELESTTDATTVSTEVLGDTGASSMGYLDSAFVAKSRLPTRRLLRPIPVYNFDGTVRGRSCFRHSHALPLSPTPFSAPFCSLPRFRRRFHFRSFWKPSPSLVSVPSFLWPLQYLYPAWPFVVFALRTLACTSPGCHRPFPPCASA